MFKEQNDRAVGVVLANLEEVVGMILDSKVENVQDGFPSLTEMVEFLIDSEYLTQ